MTPCHTTFHPMPNPFCPYRHTTPAQSNAQKVSSFKGLSCHVKHARKNITTKRESTETKHPP